MTAINLILLSKNSYASIGREIAENDRRTGR